MFCSSMLFVSAYTNVLSVALSRCMRCPPWERLRVEKGASSAIVRLPGGRAGHRRGCNERAGDLVTRQFAPRVFLQVIEVDLRSLAHLHDRRDPLAEAFVGNAHDQGVVHRGVCLEDRLDL